MHIRNWECMNWSVLRWANCVAQRLLDHGALGNSCWAFRLGRTIFGLCWSHMGVGGVTKSCSEICSFEKSNRRNDQALLGTTVGVQNAGVGVVRDVSWQPSTRTVFLGTLQFIDNNVARAALTKRSSNSSNGDIVASNQLVEFKCSKVGCLKPSTRQSGKFHLQEMMILKQACNNLQTNNPTDI